MLAKAKLPVFLIQNVGATEVRAALAFALKNDITVLRAALNTIDQHEAIMEREIVVPVGSVQFVERAMRQCGFKKPAGITYPEPLRAKGFFLRDITPVLLYDLPPLDPQRPCFIKPAGVKTFDGFVHKDHGNAALNAHRDEQLAVMGALACTTPVFISDEVRFVSEWRVYVHRHAVAGIARYDPNEGACTGPDPKWVAQVINYYRNSGQAPVAYGLDVGQLEDGRWAIVEVNDAWALGLYSDMTDHARYFQMLTDRWLQIKKPARDRWDPLWTKPAAEKLAEKKTTAKKVPAKKTAAKKATPARGVRKQSERA